MCHIARLVPAAALSLLVLSSEVAAQPPASGGYHEVIAERRLAQLDLRLRGANRNILLDTIAVWTEIPQAPAAALADARRVLDVLKLRVSGADTIARVIYNNALVARGELAGQRMSTFLRCGWGVGGDYADSWRITLGWAVYVKPAAGGGSTLGVAIAGSGQDIEGAAKPAVQCASTGAFEQLVAKEVLARGKD